MLYSIDYRKFEELFDCFYEFFPVRYTLIDQDGNGLSSSGKQSPFCDIIAGYQKAPKPGWCLQNDIAAVKAAGSLGTEDPYIYRCHCGIINVVIPIRDGEDFPGFVMLGQFLDDTPVEEQWAITRERVSDIPSLDLSALRKSFYDLPRYNSTRLRNFMRIVKAAIVGLQSEAAIHSMQMTDKDRLDAYIREHYRETIHLSDMARDLRISKSKLCALAARQNTTVVSMINRQRIYAAQQKLISGGMSIEDVAFNVGISNPNYFTILFKKIVGMTPRQYRQKMRPVQ